MPYFILRTHLAPTCITNADTIIVDLYEAYFKERFVVMTTFDMDRLLQKKWRRYETFAPLDVMMCVPRRIDQLKSVQSDSMDQYWFDKKPSKNNFVVNGKITFKRVECVICKEIDGVKIRLHNCKCIYHRKCIQQWVKYADRCPVCQCSIYKSTYTNKCNEKENEDTPVCIEVV